MYFGKRYDDEDVALDNLLYSTYHFLNRPRDAWDKLQRDMERYEDAKSRAYGTAVRYDNPLGVKVQTSPNNYFEDGMCDLVSLEHEVDMSYLVYQCEKLTVKNAIDQTPRLTWRQREILKERSRPHPLTLEKLAVLLGMDNKNKVHYQEQCALGKFAVGYIEKAGIGYDPVLTEF